MYLAGNVIKVMSMLACMFPVLYWLQHYDMTYMQIFIEYWKFYVICIVIFAAGSIVELGGE